MDTKQDAVRTGGWTRTLEELDRELGRLALLCRVPILDPGVIDRVLHGDHLVCGADNPIAFAKLRDLLMMHFAVHKKWAAELGEPEVVAIEPTYRAAAKGAAGAGGVGRRPPATAHRHAGVAATAMDTAVISVLSGLVGSLIGGSATVATAWITQRTVNKRELIRIEIGKRETLYGEFIGECSRLLVDALTHRSRTRRPCCPATRS